MYFRSLSAAPRCARAGRGLVPVLWPHTQRSRCPGDGAAALPAVNHLAIVFEALPKGGTGMNLLVSVCGKLEAL